MDNNPFRNHQSTQPNVNNTGYAGQVPQPVNNFGYTSPATGNAYPQQQQQQQQAWQNNTPYSPAQSTTYPSLQSTAYSPAQSTAYPSLQTSAQSATYPSLQTPLQTPLQTTPYSSQSTYTPPFQTSSPYNTSLMSSNPPTSGVVSGGNTYQPYQAAMPSTPNFQQSPYQQTYPQQPQQSTYPQPMFGNQPQYGTGVNQPNNSFYIPDSFGQSNNNIAPNNNMNNTQPKHAPVDATALLKGTQVRRVECPVCQKMIEGDDMAVNHHVNEHYS